MSDTLVGIEKKLTSQLINFRAQKVELTSNLEICNENILRTEGALESIRSVMALPSEKSKS